jgi:hypothetical protein
MKKCPHRFKVQNLKSNITIFLLAVHWYFLLFFYPIPGRQAGSLFQYDEVNPQKIYIIPESASLVLPDVFFSPNYNFAKLPSSGHMESLCMKYEIFLILRPYFTPAEN